MKLIVGLGNPGSAYDRTRHNVGFDCLDRVAQRAATDTTPRGRFHGALVEAHVAGEKTLLLKPATYMNRSGLAVSEAVSFYKLDPAEDLLVIVDDVALECGVIRLRAAGGAGGHNGLTNIEMMLGTSGYPRLRIGIDPPGAVPQSDYVLGRFTPEQRERVAPALEEAAEAALFWITHGSIETMNRYNRKNSESLSQENNSNV